ncbi:uncharacterized protein LOC144105104 [Amblyomma americanum]
MNTESPALSSRMEEEPPELPVVPSPRRERALDCRCLLLTLCLSCSVAVFTIVVVYFYFFPVEEEKGTRVCGDVSSWGETYLKGKFDTCLGTSICELEPLCEAQDTVTCNSRVPWFGGRCECCDWCLLRTLACVDKDHDRASFQYCQLICKHL